MKGKSYLAQALALTCLACAQHQVRAASCPSTSLCLNDTVYYDGSVQAASTGSPTNGPISIPAHGVSYGIADAFGASDAVSPVQLFPVSDTGGTSPTYDFYDDYYFTITGGATAYAAAISDLGMNGISDLQIRLFSSSGEAGPTNGTPTLGVPSGGALDGWTIPYGPNGSMSMAFTNDLPAGTYDLQIRGQVNTDSGTGGYGGDLDLTPVPLPAGLPMLLCGLGLVGALARRRRSVPVR
jgi:hypothetical protein